MRTITILCLLFAVLAACNRDDGFPAPDPAALGETRTFAAPEVVGKNGEELPLDVSFDDTYWGARLFLSYYPGDREFRGMVFNVGGTTRPEITVEVRLSNGTELRAAPVKRLKVGDFKPVALKAPDEPFTSWTVNLWATESSGD